MARFEDHINQAKRNLKFLSTINAAANDCWDWQVTTCFYTGVHLVGAILAKEADLHIDNHSDTLRAINPADTNNKIVVPEEFYLAYRKLFNDSIRSRYLNIHGEEKTPDYDTHVAYLTHDKHFKKAVKQLDKILDYVSNKYNIKFDAVDLDCIELRKAATELKFFNYKQKVMATA